jgi:hypothetical protein
VVVHRDDLPAERPLGDEGPGGLDLGKLRHGRHGSARLVGSGVRGRRSGEPAIVASGVRESFGDAA